MTDFLLIADVDWAGLAGFIVMLLIYGINALFDKAKQGNSSATAERLRRALEEQQRAAQREQSQSSYEQHYEDYDHYGDGDEDEDEYDEYNAGEKPQPTEVDAFLQEVAALRNRTRGGSRPVVAEVVTPEIVEEKRESIAEHVEGYMARRESHEPTAEQRVDSKIDDAMPAKFDHSLGALGTEDMTDDTYDKQAVRSAPHPIFGVIRDPERFRRTFVASEAFSRPDWDKDTLG